MKKIYNCIPGDFIDDSTIVNRIFTLIHSIEFDAWIEINETIYSSDFFKDNDEFYVLYLDPRGVIKRLYNTCRNEIVGFMKDHIDYEEGEGIDIAICTKEFNNAVICNHDGQIFILKV